MIAYVLLLWLFTEIHAPTWTLVLCWIGFGTRMISFVLDIIIKTLERVLEE